MKKLVFFTIAMLGIVGMTSCETKKEQAQNSLSMADSLQQIVNQKDNELNDMVSTLNEIQEGFRQINEAQGRITLERQKGEQNRHAVIAEDMKFIQQTMRLNSDLIANLRTQLKQSKSATSKLRQTLEATIASLTTQLEDLTQQMQSLRTQLAEKDITIAEQGEQIGNLKSNVSELSVQNEVKARTMQTQDKEINTAYYVFGTKNELKEQNILKSGEVLRDETFNKDYFTRIDIRVDKVIKLYSKRAELCTNHPAGSYSLDRDDKGQYTLRITDPERFWSVSKYLVIIVK